MDPQTLPWLMLGGAAVVLLVFYVAVRAVVKVIRWLFRL